MQKLATFPNCWRKIMRKCGVNGTTWLSLSSISNLLDLWWENSKFPNMHRWILMLRCQICIHGFVKMPKKETKGGVNDIQGKGRRGRPVWQLIRAQSSQTESFLVGCPFVLHCTHCSHVHTYTFKNCHLVSPLNILKACKTSAHLRTI